MKRVAVAILMIVSLVACAQKGTEQKGGASGGAFLAKVGNAPITQADYEREFESLPDYAKQMVGGAEGKEKFLDELVKKELLYQEALKKGLDKSPEYTKKLEDFKKLTLISGLLQNEIVSKAKVSDQEVKDFYEKHKQDFSSTSQIKASHILVKTEDEARKIIARLKKGEKFEDIARKESLDKSSAKNGGDLGYFSKGQMVPEFERAAVGLKVGEISEPVKTEFGYHIIKVTDKKVGPQVELSKVKDVIMQKLSGEKQKEVFDKYVADLRKNYKIEINKDAVAKLPAPSAEAPHKESK